MMNKPEPLKPRERVARRRAVLRAQGLKVKQIYVPDLSDPRIRREIHDDCQRIAASPSREEDIAFAEALQYWPPDDPD
jgi:hypothetical protein